MMTFFHARAQKKWINAGRLAEMVKGILSAMGVVINAGLGLVALWAIGALFGGSLITFLIAGLFIALFEPIAPLIAMYATITMWRWPWMKAVIVFVWPLIFLVVSGNTRALFILARKNLKRHDSNST